MHVCDIWILCNSCNGILSVHIVATTAFVWLFRLDAMNNSVFLGCSNVALSCMLWCDVRSNWEDHRSVQDVCAIKRSHFWLIITRYFRCLGLLVVSEQQVIFTCYWIWIGYFQLKFERDTIMVTPHCKWIPLVRFAFRFLSGFVCVMLFVPCFRFWLLYMILSVVHNLVNRHWRSHGVPLPHSVWGQSRDSSKTSQLGVGVILDWEKCTR